MLPNALRRPPMTAVGSSPARSSMSAIIDVVDVLPCDARHGDPRSQAHQLGEHLGTRDHRHVPAPRLDDLGIERLHRRRHDHDVGVTDVRRVVPLVHAHTERREPRRDWRRLRVGSADGVAEVGEQFRDAAHADPADADEVDGPCASEHCVLPANLRLALPP